MPPPRVGTHPALSPHQARAHNAAAVPYIILCTKIDLMTMALSVRVRDGWYGQGIGERVGGTYILRTVCLKCMLPKIHQSDFLLFV